jgi:hypothetical protein
MGSFYGISSVQKTFLGGAVFAAGDIVMWQGTTVGTGGELVIATAGTALLFGVSLGTGANATDVQIDITPGLVVYMDNDNDTNTFGAGYVGQMADLIGATGAMLVDTSSHTTNTSAQMACVGYDPRGNDASMGAYLLKERAFGF